MTRSSGGSAAPVACLARALDRIRRGVPLLMLACLPDASQAVVAALPEAESVAIVSLDRDPAGAPVILTALLFRPPAPGDARRAPLVIALHGCGGMFAARAGGNARLSARFAHWTRQLLDDGYAVLWPDSFNPRGRREVCTIRSGERTIDAARRRLDALGALKYAARLPGIDPARIALIGWSHGGSTALAVLNVDNARVAEFRSGQASAPWFRAAVAFYPGCSASLRAGTRWSPGAPLAIHIGELDDWTPAAPCVALGEALQARGESVQVDVYPDSYHGFDAPGGRVTLRRDVPNGVRPGEGVHIGPNAAAGTLAAARVREYLHQRIGTGAGVKE